MPQHVFTIPQVREIVPHAITGHPPRNPAHRPSPSQRELVAAAVLRSPLTGATVSKPR